MNIDAKQAVEIAANYYKAIAAESQKLSVEEIEMDDAGSHWLITLGIGEPFSAIQFTTGQAKSFKIFKIDANTGEVKSMKIRKV